MLSPADIPEFSRGLPVEFRDELRWIKSDSVREVQEFHDIDAPFAALDSRDVGLPTIQPLGERGLGVSGPQGAHRDRHVCSVSPLSGKRLARVP